MRTIYKYQLAIINRQQIDMPEGAEILCVQVQNGVPYLWVKVDTAKAIKHRYFVIYGTGHEIDEYVAIENYIGTFQMNDGRLVWHLFELI